LQEYRRTAFQFWNELQVNIKRDIAEKYWTFELQRATPAPPPRPVMTENGPAETESGNGKTQPAKSKKIGPNEPCFCGSGKKYKKCHGSVASPLR
jgi:preprotein translocase subunit SecA